MVSTESAKPDWQPFVSSNPKVTQVIPLCPDCQQPGHLQRSLNGPAGFAIYRVVWLCCGEEGPIGGFASEAVQMSIALIQGPPK